MIRHPTTAPHFGLIPCRRAHGHEATEHEIALSVSLAGHAHSPESRDAAAVPPASHAGRALAETLLSGLRTYPLRTYSAKDAHRLHEVVQTVGTHSTGPVLDPLGTVQNRTVRVLLSMGAQHAIKAR